MPKDEHSELVEAMRQVIIEANNSLYGSQSFFLTTKDGSVVGAVGVTGEPDKYHLAKKIEELKADARKSYRAPLEPQAGVVEALREALKRLIEACEARRVEEFDPASRVTVLETRTKDILDFHDALDEAVAALQSRVSPQEGLRE